jgi:hypothetical protein
VGTFIPNGEVVSINTSGCAALALGKIAPIESFVTQIEDENACEDGNKTLFDILGRAAHPKFPRHL